MEQNFDLPIELLIFISSKIIPVCKLRIRKESLFSDSILLKSAFFFFSYIFNHGKILHNLPSLFIIGWPVVLPKITTFFFSDEDAQDQMLVHSRMEFSFLSNPASVVPHIFQSQ
jgi:hypothetical protein